MIDWITALLPCSHAPLNGGCVVSIGPDGDEEWRSERKVRARGSFESSIDIRSQGGDGKGGATHLFIDGNPSKFLQGHNLFGSDDLVSLMREVFARLVDQFSLTPTNTDWAMVEAGDYTVCCIDYTRSFELPTRGDVKAWLRAAEFKAKSRHGRPSSKGGTLYFGQRSRRWCLKFYCKGEEIEAPKHTLPYELQLPDLIAWADNKLRAELRLRTRELIDIQLRRACDLTPDRLAELFNEYVRGLDMSEQIALTTEALLALPQRLRSSYVLWKSGEDLRGTLSKNTYYKHRKELREYGIDIAIRCEVVDRSNVVPLVRVLEAVPVGIPDFAFTQGLVHSSVKKAG